MDVADEIAVHHRTMRRWVVVVVLAGVAVLAVGGVMLAAGLDTADKLGSVVGAVCGVVGLGMSTYGLVVARSASQQTDPETRTSVTNSVPGANLAGDVTQVGSVGRDLVTGGTNVSGTNPVVAGPGGTAIGHVESMVLPEPAMTAEPLPPPTVELCIGRAEQIHAVSTAWRTGQWVAVTGGPGIGKSTLLGRALGLDAIATAFKDRRFVVSCDGATTAGIVIDKLATALGVGLGEHLRNRVVSFLRVAPCVLVLDNFETVTDADPAGASELLLTLRAVPGLVAGIGSRGSHVPAGLVGLREVSLGPLPQDDAVDVFAAVAGERHRADPAIEALMADLDGVPLAIVLMASLARTEAHLDTLVTAWRAKRTDLLQHGVNPDRTSSLPVSIELSWDQLSQDGRTTLSLAALLPDGWPRHNSRMYLPDDLAAGVIELSHRALLHDDELRQRCLAPLRQHVLIRHPPDSVQMGLLVAPVRTLAARAAQVGRTEGGQATTDVAAELTNLVEIIRTGLPSTPALGDAVPDLLQFQRFTGLGDDQVGLEALASAPSGASHARTTFALALFYLSRSNNEQARTLLNQALPVFQRIGDVLGEAHCLSNLGQLAFRESDNNQARTLFKQALSLYQRIGHILGIAHCLNDLGEMASIESDNDQARTLLNQALPLYQRIGDLLGEANCLSILGQLALVESDYDHARTVLNQALPLYQQIGAVQGEANCLRALAELALRKLSYNEARTLLDRALHLFQRIGAVLGEANCLRALAELAIAESNYDQARTLFNQALHLSQRIGAVLSEANCLSNLGQLALVESNYDHARTLLDQALHLYQRIGDVLGEAHCLSNLGRLALVEPDYDQARALLNQALHLYERARDRYSAAITHAWLARVTDNELHDEHLSQADQLAAELNLPSLYQSLREIADL